MYTFIFTNAKTNEFIASVTASPDDPIEFAGESACLYASLFGVQVKARW